MLGVFLVPASGVFIFVHQCRSMGVTRLSLDGTTTCCSGDKIHFSYAEGNLCKADPAGSCTHKTFIGKKTCCSDTRLFIKIVPEYVYTVTGNIQPVFFHLPPISRLLNIGSVKEPVASFLRDAPDPPGYAAYILNSVLRF